MDLLTYSIYPLKNHLCKRGLIGRFGKCPILGHNTVLDVVFSTGGRLSLHFCISGKNKVSVLTSDTVQYHL